MLIINENPSLVTIYLKERDNYATYYIFASRE
jgi:hypothetical protein